MPTIQWNELPHSLRDHLFERALKREIKAGDLAKLYAWVQSKPEAPDGDWVKDFGSFKIVGKGALPKTFLLPGQPAKGAQLP